MTAPTKDKTHAVPKAPREHRGETVGEISSTPKVRGYAPPIIDTLPEAATAAAPVLPRLWLSFHSDGKTLYCSASLQRVHMQRVQLDATNDPIVAQAYAFFLQQCVARLDGLPLPPTPEPAPEAQSEAPLEPKPQGEDDGPPTNPTNPVPGTSK